ncbi:MAG TPA: hypothetical protein VFF17_02850 [Thermoanaerobaculia bacterium]|nr:hypothetical protein [Thermoanaerobaculia bacterium]
MRRRRPGGAAALLLVLLCASVLTVVGLALKFSTDAERIGAAQEWLDVRAFYAADAGIRWTIAQMTRSPAAFLARPEFREPPDPFGTVRFPFPAHRHGSGGPFSGDPGDDGIEVVVESPSPLGRRPYPRGEGEPERGSEFLYAFEVRVRASEAAPVPRFSIQLCADVEVGPLPEDFLDRGAIIAGGRQVEKAMTATGAVEPRPLRAVSRNWKVQ